MAHSHFPKRTYCASDILPARFEIGVPRGTALDAPGAVPAEVERQGPIPTRGEPVRERVPRTLVVVYLMCQHYADGAVPEEATVQADAVARVEA